MKLIGHPIIGNATHGKGILNRHCQQAFGYHRLLLACTRLTLQHPVSGKKSALAARRKGSFLCC